MWQLAITNNRTVSSRFFNLFSLIILPMLYTSGLIDSLVAYLAKLDFLPHVPSTLTGVLFSIPPPVLYSILVALHMKFNNRILYLISGILICPICYILPFEIDISYMPINYTIIAYTNHQCFDLCAAYPGIAHAADRIKKFLDNFAYANPVHFLSFCQSAGAGVQKLWGVYALCYILFDFTDGSICNAHLPWLQDKA